MESTEHGIHALRSSLRSVITDFRYIAEPTAPRFLLSLSVFETGGERGPATHQKHHIGARRYDSSATINDLAHAAFVGAEDGEVRVFLTKFNVWDATSCARWIQLDDFEITIGELQQSYSGFNAIKFVVVHEDQVAILH